MTQGSEENIMQSNYDLLRAITELDPSDRRALLHRLTELTTQSGENETDPKFVFMEEAMKDELFLGDLREVMEDFQ
jgi:hypothetical protein